MKYTKLLLSIFVVLVIVYVIYYRSFQRATIHDVWYINLDRDMKRNEHMQTNIQNFGVPVTRWTATYGKEMRRDIAAKEYGVCTSITRSNDDDVNKINPYVLHQPGVIGCWISHKRLLTHLNTLALPSSHGHFIIEDDIEIAPDFQRRWSALSHAVPYNWDILYFFTGGTHGDPITPGVLRWKNDKYAANWGTQAYLVRHGALPRILDKLRYMDSPIDVQFYRHFGDFNVYILDPPLITPGDFVSSIEKQKK